MVKGCLPIFEKTLKTLVIHFDSYFFLKRSTTFMYDHLKIDVIGVVREFIKEAPAPT